MRPAAALRLRVLHGAHIHLGAEGMRWYRRYNRSATACRVQWQLQSGLPEEIYLDYGQQYSFQVGAS